VRTAYPLPDLRELVEAVNRGGTAVALGGVIAPARGLALAALARAGMLKKKTVAVMAHQYQVEETEALLEVLAPEIRVLRAPADAAGIYRGIEAPLNSRIRMVRNLALVARGKYDVFLIPAPALPARIPDPSLITKHTVTLKKNRPLDPEQLLRNLILAGYHRVDMVQDAGDVAPRGWVIDVHPGTDHALRIELDDDRVESLRYFDPSTQRSIGEELEEIELLPMDLFPVRPEILRSLSHRFSGEFPALSTAIGEGLQRRLWWGMQHLVHENTRNLLDLGEELLICDLDEVAGELGRSYSVQKREWRTLADRDIDLPGPEETLENPEVLLERLGKALLRIEQLEVSDGKTRWFRLRTHPMESYVRRIPDLVPAVRQRRAEDLAQLLVVDSENEQRRFENLLKAGDVIPVSPPPRPGQVALIRAGIQEGFLVDDGLAVYGRKKLTAAPRPRKGPSHRAFISDFRDLRPGNLVVHTDHGIGRFKGFRRTRVDGRLMEMMVLEYRNGDTLLVPVQRADLIQKFSGSDNEGHAPLDRLGGSTWKRKKARVRKAVREMAAELLRLAAVRRSAEGFAHSPDSPWQREFEDAFAWELTPDQSRAVEEIKADMESSLPMDRLLCGDVGFGKTEVALRAAFKAVLGGKQVALLAPTTILVDQHYKTFLERMAGFPVEIRMLSRFSAPAEAKKTLQGLADGRVDIVIGTHRLLGSSVRFRDLGLVILDEEQRFGVAQKERLKALRMEVDVLAMSATPIPRTLNMAFSGLRSISIIESPPRDRQAVETTVLEFSEEVIREAILHEIERGGQVFFVHNRVRSLGAFASWLREAVPEARIVVGHGQMPEKQLEKAMETFLSGSADVLLASTIIENGIDIPNANTLLVNRADRFGLAQLYQLRGRVGRSDRLAYAYFLVPPGQPLSTNARARLRAVQEFCELGAGFRIAARDLEIRGAGNMLGAEQHGFIDAVGFETYCELLNEAVAELEGKAAVRKRPLELRLGLDLQLPEDYIPQPALRLSFYKRLSSAEDEETLEDLVAEITDRYGPGPEQLENLVQAQKIRTAAGRAGLVRLERRAGTWKILLDPSIDPSPELGRILNEIPGSRISRTGEISIPTGEGRFGLHEILAFLEDLR